MLSPRLQRSNERPTLTLKDKINFGKKHVGETVEMICDNNPGYMDYLVDSGIINLDRWAKLYLAARRRKFKHEFRDEKASEGMLDYGPREIDSFTGLLSKKFYGHENE